MGRGLVTYRLGGHRELSNLGYALMKMGCNCNIELCAASLLQDTQRSGLSRSEDLLLALPTIDVAFAAVACAQIT